MAMEVIMPKLGMTMEQGTIVRWLREEGDQVEKGEPILEIETDKVVMEVESPASGTLAGISAGPDEVVPVTEVIAYILKPGEKLEAVAKPPAKEAAPPPKEQVAATPRAPAPKKKIAVTPRARRLAREHEVDLAQVQGSRPGGRIVEADVIAFIEKREAARSPKEALKVKPIVKVKKKVPLRGRRKIIAERMQESAQEAPHIALTMEVNMSEAERARRGCSFTALIVQAVADALRQHPMVNASLQGDVIILYDEVNVGVAVATKEGLLVPVVKRADAKSLFEIDAEIKSLAQSAGAGKLTLEEVSRGTFTVSNLGMFGVDEFQAIINPPQSAILAIGAIVKKPMAKDGRVAIRPMMKMTISADHRILDGATAAEFLRDVKTSLERLTEKVEVRGAAKIAVIGGGFGGYAAALRAAQLGAEVTLIEKGKLGGTCLNAGCIPTKILLEAAQRLIDLESMSEHGIRIDGFTFDLDALMKRKDRIVNQLVKGIEKQLDDSGVRVLRGVASLVSAHQLRVELNHGGSEEIEATGVIVATGSAPASIAGLEGALTSREALSLTEMPKHLVIVGGGAIGVEFACFFSAFGAEVTIVEALPRILPAEDKDISRGITWLLERRGVRMLTDSRVKRMDGDELVIVTQEEERRLRAERILVAVGRVPYTDGLNFEALGVKTRQGAVLVNERMETNVPGIYAVGDVTGKHFLAHVASAEGEVAAENAVGRFKQMDHTVIPHCIFSVPEVAAVGLTEEEARQQGHDVTVATFPWTSSEKAIIEGEIEGMVKIVTAEGRLLGMHILGQQASSLIMEGALAMAVGAELGGQELSRIASLIHPHPTLSEAIGKIANNHIVSHPAPPGRAAER